MGMLRREIRPGENTAEARARWKRERQQEITMKKDKECLELAKEKAETKEAKQRIVEEMRILEEKRLKKRDQGLQRSVIIPPPKPMIMPPPMFYIPGDKKLSILICSIVGRELLLQNLVNELKRQSISKTDDVEILMEVDNKEISTGAKRNILLKRARGDYICFVDDDDKVSYDYVAKILEAVESNPDCCSLVGLLIRNLNRKTLRRMRRRREKVSLDEIQSNLFIHSLKYKEWFEKDGVYYRCPNHLNVVKRELALQVGFSDVSQSEDRAYSLKLFPLLKTESVIEGIIYYYEKL